VRAFGADWAWGKLRRAGAIVGSEEGQQLARSVNRHLPELRTHDRFGHRIDQVEFHPAYHELMRLIFSTETHSLAWTDEGRTGAHVARAALSYLWNQGENGVCCPMGMTFASIAALRNNQGMVRGDERRSSRPPIPIRQGSTVANNGSTRDRCRRRRTTTAPSRSTPCTWNTDLAMSNPTTTCPIALLPVHPSQLTLLPGGRAVHGIISRNEVPSRRYGTFDLLSTTPPGGRGDG
jgi:hypothetical protein